MFDSRPSQPAALEDGAVIADSASKAVDRVQTFMSGRSTMVGAGFLGRETRATTSDTCWPTSRNAALGVTTPDHIIYVVEDEAAMREAVCDLLGSIGLNARPFSSPREFLDYQRPDLPSCILLDIGLPGISGLELQARLAEKESPPIIFLTGSADVPSSVAAMKQGAVDFLTKPFKEAELIDAVRMALEKDRLHRSESAELAKLKARVDSLSERELQVMRLIIGGLMNKQAAAELGIQEVTLQVHRSRVMQKMEADSLADLVRMAERLHISPSASRRAPRLVD